MSIPIKAAILAWAEQGAMARLRALNEERDAIYRQFPHLKNAGAFVVEPPAAPVAALPFALSVAPSAPEAPKSNRKPMTKAQRLAVGKRMKAMWAAKRAEKEAK